MRHNNSEGDAKEENKEKVEENSKQKLIKLRGTNRLMKTTKVAYEGERKKLSKENAPSGEGKVGQKELASKGISRQETKKVASKKTSLKGKDVPGTFHRIKPSNKPEMGMIFMCNSETRKDCFRYNVLGLPENKRELVGNVYKGMILFLYDVDLKLMYGIYKSTGPGGYNIEPYAFKSQFPSQVRFKILDRCKPLAEENFRKAIQKNYYTRSKFDCKLTSEQVKDLCKIFRASSRRSSGEKLERQFKVGKDFGYNKRRSVVEDRRYYGHPHGYERGEVGFQRAQEHWFPPAHERNPEINTYRRRPLAKARDDSFRHDLVEEPWDAYERDMLLDQQDYYRQEPVLESSRSYYKQDGIMDHDDFRPLDFNPRWDDEIRNRRSYDHYESPSYHDHDYRMIPPEQFSAEYIPAYHSPKYHSEYRDADFLPDYRLSSRR